MMTSLKVAEFNRLKHSQQIFESENDIINFFKTHENDIELSTFDVEINRKRNTELNNFHSNVVNIFKDLKIGRTFIRNENIDDLASFKKHMIILQDNIYNLNFKIKSNLEILENEEKELVDDLGNYNKQLDEWNIPIKYSTILNFRMNIKCDNSSLEITKEVEQFQKFVEKSKGHTNGWPEKDHQMFVKFKRKYRKIDIVANHLHKFLPDKTEEDIRQHDKWYKEYLTLQNQMKQSLSEWRQKKSEKICCSEKAEISAKVNSKPTVKPLDKDIKVKIAEWKLEKETKRRQELALKEQGELERKRLEKEKQKNQIEVKKSVDKWKEIRESRKQLEMLKKEIEETSIKKQKSIEANRMIKHFQSQDDYFISKMRQAKSTNAKTEIKRSKSSQLATRDPDRLLRPTKQWMQRTLKREPSKVVLNIPNIRRIPKLKIPEWRQNTLPEVHI